MTLPDNTLTRILETDNEAIRLFGEDYPQAWSGISKAIHSLEEVLPKVYEIIEQAEMEIFRLGLWGSVRLYQINALFSILSRHLDEGLAVLRMATELTRDLKCIGDDPRLRDLWVRSTDKSAQREYRKLFKFDLTNSFEKQVFATYNFCSDYGIHGHKTSAVFLETTFNIAKSTHETQVSEAGVFLVLSHWMISFFQMHNVALQTFSSRYKDELFGIEIFLLKAETELLVCLQEIKKMQNSKQTTVVYKFPA